MDFDEGIEFIFYAKKQLQDEQLFQRWIHGYQTEMTFKEFKDKLTSANKEEEAIPQTEEEAQERALAILEKVKGILGEE